MLKENKPVGRPTRSGKRWRARRASAVPAVMSLAIASAVPSPLLSEASASASAGAPKATGTGTVWLCRPGLSNDPCALSLTATQVGLSGTRTVYRYQRQSSASKFDCFYVYPTVSTEQQPNADLAVQSAERFAASSQVARFSQVCQVWAPIYKQMTLWGLAHLSGLPAFGSVVTAYQSIRSGFEDYLEHDNHGRPFVVIGHSQGAAMLILLLSRLVDSNAALRHRLVLAIILGGNVVVPLGKKLTGGSFAHISVCNSAGEAGCVVAYSSFPGEPPPKALFGRPGQGVSLQSGQVAKAGLQVVCVNPAAIGGGSVYLAPFFPSLGRARAPWVTYPGLYRASCQHRGGATWLNVAKATPSSDRRPVVTELSGPEWGYHVYDVNLALGNLVPDVAAAEVSYDRK